MTHAPQTDVLHGLMDGGGSRPSHEVGAAMDVHRTPVEDISQAQADETAGKVQAGETADEQSTPPRIRTQLPRGH